MSLPLGGAKAALFDLDGVVLDTETQYSEFWEQLFADLYDGRRDLSDKIKGQTLVQIFDRWFSGPMESLRPAVRERLDAFERSMSFPYIPGSREFILSLRSRGLRTAIVTSSNLPKMQNVFRSHPEIFGMFDAILTAEDFERSKPDPDCYLKAAARLGFAPSECVVFEDSFNGIRSARAAGIRVIGLATTNPADAIAPLCDAVIPDFSEA